MVYDPQKHHRRSIRLKEYDYSRAGAYFVTICVQNGECLFGEIVDGIVRLNEFGQIVEDEWRQTGRNRINIKLDVYVVMPNHFHGILFIHGDGGGTARRAPTVERFGKPVSGSVPTIVRSFKSAVTKRVNEIRHTPGGSVWQRNYYEHIIRDDDDLNRIRQYIADNPARWTDDENHPANIKPLP